MSLAPLALTVLLAATAFKASPRLALATVLGTILLVPDTAFPQGSGFDNLPIYRIVLIAFVGGLVGRVLRGEASADIFLPRRVHAAFLVWLGSAAVMGIALAEPGLGLTPRYQSFLLIVDQTLVFVGVVAVVRLLGDAWVAAKILAGVAAVMVAVALSEQIFEWSYARWILTKPGIRQGVLGSQQLEVRGDSTRVRAAAQFALGYAWVGALVLPLLMAVAARAKARIMWALPILGALTIVWTRSRSPLAAIALGVVLFAALNGFPRRLVAFAAVAALGCAAVYLSEPSLRDPFSPEATEDSDRSRNDRQAVGLDRAAERPLVGHALGSVGGRFGLHGLDLEYLTVYVELGVIGLVLLGFLFGAALLGCGAGLRAPPGRQRMVAAATTTAAAIGLAASAAYDFLHVPGSAIPYWAVVAIGVANAEQVLAERERVAGPRHRVLTVRATLLHVALPVTGLGVGFLLAATAPSSAEWSATFETMPVYAAATANGDFEFTGKLLSEDACRLARSLEPRASDVRCLALGASGGLGYLTWRGPSSATVRDDAFATVVVLRRAFPGFRAHPVTLQPVSGPPTWRTTAPAWMSLSLAMIAMSGLLPPRRRPASEVQDAMLETASEPTGAPRHLPTPVP